MIHEYREQVTYTLERRAFDLLWAAEKAGLKVGDEVERVSYKSIHYNVIGESVSQFIDWLPNLQPLRGSVSGRVGNRVELSVRRGPLVHDDRLVCGAELVWMDTKRKTTFMLGEDNDQEAEASKSYTVYCTVKSGEGWFYIYVVYNTSSVVDFV